MRVRRRRFEVGAPFLLALSYSRLACAKLKRVNTGRNHFGAAPLYFSTRVVNVSMLDLVAQSFGRFEFVARFLRGTGAAL